MRTFGKTRYYVIRVRDHVEMRVTKIGIKRVTSKLSRTGPDGTTETLSQVYYDGGKVLAIRAYDDIFKSVVTLRKDQALEVSEAIWKRAINVG